jgi:peptidoglycan/LPS O-acetylase OafA/YrhL
MLCSTMAAPWFGGKYVDGVYWTLAVELHFYAVAALATVLAGRRNLDIALFGWMAWNVLVRSVHKWCELPAIGSYEAYFCVGAAIFFLHYGERPRCAVLFTALSLLFGLIDGE